MLRLKRIFCSFQGNLRITCLIVEGLPRQAHPWTVGWNGYAKARQGVSLPVPEYLLRISPSVWVSSNWITRNQGGISAMIFCQWWSQFLVIYFNFPLLIDEQMNTYWLSHGLCMQGCRIHFLTIAKWFSLAQDQITEFSTVKPGVPECASVYPPRLQTLQEYLPSIGQLRHFLSITEQMCNFSLLVRTVPHAESAWECPALSGSHAQSGHRNGGVSGWWPLFE